MNARSEFVSLPSPGVLGLVNLSEGGVVDTSRRFQIASPGLYQPARNPMRGSGLGGDVDMSMADEVVVAHEAAHSDPMASSATRVSVWGFMAWWAGEDFRASCSCGRSQSFDRPRRPRRIERRTRPARRPGCRRAA